MPPRTPDGLTLAFRHANLALRARTIRDYTLLWPLFDGTTGTFDRWFSAVALLIQRDRHVSAGLAAHYLQAHRQAAGLKGRAPIVLAEDAPQRQIAITLAATTYPHIRKAATLEAGLRTAFVTSSGGAANLVLNGGRDTVVGSVHADRRAVGWMRSTSGKPCAFCAMLASRGAVYKSQETADFKTHDHCSCVPEPVYEGGSTLPKGPAADWARLYDEHARGQTNQVAAFRRAYEAA